MRDAMHLPGRPTARAFPALLALALILPLLVGCGGAGTPAALPAGPWRAWLDSPGGELPFGLELYRDGDDLEAWLTNGDERIAVDQASFADGELVLDIEHYDASITARLDASGTRLDGRWRKTASGGQESSLPFHATAGGGPRFAPPPGAAAPATDPAAVAGRWSVTFSESDDPAVAVFDVGGDGTVRGTFLTTTGDYRYLAGAFHGDTLRLSCFDGAHAFLFHATLQDDGSLRGDFWSRDTWHETWNARRDDDAQLPDAFSLTRWAEDADLSRYAFPDLEGKMRTLDDPQFAGRARLVVVFGSWCPNCNDASDYLVELHRRYAGQGLSILGLAFEMTGDPARDTEQVRRYAAYHGIEYPILIAGLSDKEQASQAFPLIDRVRSFPTTIFLDAGNNVRAVHTGWTGPATGNVHDELRARFEALIEELLADAPPRV